MRAWRHPARQSEWRRTLRLIAGAEAGSPSEVSGRVTCALFPSQSPVKIAYRHLPGASDESPLTWSYERLERRAGRVAAALSAAYSPGDRIVLPYPAGPDITAAFLGCLSAGMVAVPASMPDVARFDPRCPGSRGSPRTVRRQQRSRMPRPRGPAGTGDGRPADFPPGQAGLRWIACDTLPDGLAADHDGDRRSRGLTTSRRTSAVTCRPRCSTPHPTRPYSDWSPREEFLERRSREADYAQRYQASEKHSREPGPRGHRRRGRVDLRRLPRRPPAAGHAARPTPRGWL
ncbi:AMP-binding protein [Catenulispora subtropica]|uniref:AMP-binding protein n=1 Tax=Catenulispora subtropica TaxID=450798 RepID=UPI003CD08641